MAAFRSRRKIWLKAALQKLSGEARLLDSNHSRLKPLSVSLYAGIMPTLMRGYYSTALLFWTLLSSPTLAFANEDDFRIPFAAEPATPDLPPAEIFARTQAVLSHFSAPEEADSQPFVAPYAGLQTKSGAEAVLAIADPMRQFVRFGSLGESGIAAFLDRDVRGVPDYDVGFAPAKIERAPDAGRGGLVSRLRKAANNPRRYLLEGLKVMLDPGHMGGQLWDARTGKYVHDAQGAKLSEGVLNLQTALLLERELTELGATVRLTHRSFAPTSTLSWETLPLEVFGRSELRRQSLAPWFQGLLDSAPAGEELYATFALRPEFQHLFSEAARAQYFLLRADLDARADSIADFAPDITLVLHYDAWDNTVGTRRYDRTKVYILGDIDPAEFATRSDRLFLARHMLDPETWDASLELGRSVVRSLRRNLRIEYDEYGGGVSHAVEPGVFARNLVLSRKTFGHAVTYIEALHYNDPEEFAALRDYKYDLSIDGVNYPYSDRLLVVVDAIRQGVLNFVESFRTVVR